MQKKVTVIGNGPLSFSVAAQVAKQEDETIYVDVSKKDNFDLDNHEIKVIGVEEYNTTLKKVT